MIQTIAFLRAINVGGHTVKMERLRSLFGDLGYENVSTFIASGNVIFDAPPGPLDEVSRRIESHLLQALGYEVSVFLRTPAEVAAIARQQPFPEAHLQNAGAFNVIFLQRPLDAVSQARMRQFETELDEFVAIGCEIYWLCQVSQSQSKFSNAAMERALKLKSTIRGINTIQRLTAIYPTTNVGE
jgi:uncharacterized protein (DUF1697 family)